VKTPARLILCTVLALLVAAAPAEARKLQTGFHDSVYFSSSPEERAVWLDRAVAAQANFVRLMNGWRGIAPQRPAAPEDPADPVYRWGGLDAAIRDASARGLEPMVALTGAPAWAEGPNRPEWAREATWRPNARAYGQFARALALRYSGSYRDPRQPGAPLPRVRFFEPWNEPNLQAFLAPQWVTHKGRWRPESPIIYRALLNSFARGVKSVHSSNRVLAGTVAPFGDLDPGGTRMAPAQFVRSMLSRPTVFDVLTTHPYSVRGPFSPAYNDDDVTIPDVWKLKRPLRRAERAGRISPRGRKQIWVTEVSFDSSPPDPGAVPERKHARWLAETFFVLWRQGVNRVTWFQIRDQEPIPNYASSFQSGIFFRDGRPKLARRAFAFPFVAKAQARGRALLWARAPQRGRLVFERKTRRGWQRVAAGRAGRHHVLTRRVRVPKRTVMRVRSGKLTSLTARVR
jgi:hypothetical protein